MREPMESAESTPAENTDTTPAAPAVTGTEAEAGQAGQAGQGSPSSAPAGPPQAAETVVPAEPAGAESEPAAETPETPETAGAPESAAAEEQPAPARTRRRATRRASAPAGPPQAAAQSAEPEPAAEAAEPAGSAAPAESAVPAAEEQQAPARTRRRTRRTAEKTDRQETAQEKPAAEEPARASAEVSAGSPAEAEKPARTRKSAKVRAAEAAESAESAEAEKPVQAAEAGPATSRRSRRKPPMAPVAVFQAPVFAEPVFQTPETAAAAATESAEEEPETSEETSEEYGAETGGTAEAEREERAAARRRRRRRRNGEPAEQEDRDEQPAAGGAGSGTGAGEAAETRAGSGAAGEGGEEDEETYGRGEAGEGEERPSRRRRRGGRRRRRGSDAETSEDTAEGEEGDEARESAGETGEAAAESGREDGERGEDAEEHQGASSSTSRRRRRRRRRGGEAEPQAAEVAPDDPERTVVKVREPRKKKDESSESADGVQSIKGSTRLEAKKQRRREGREQGRRRVPIITEAEFLARREAVERVMVVRQSGERTQIGVLEDGVLVEHFVNKEQATSYVGNVYLGKVQNVLPSMEAAFVDIGKGRNAVLYAGEVNFEALGMSGGPRRIETALKSGQSVLVQVTKDPIGHKGARLTSQVSLPGRYLVYVPEGSMTGISRKLPDTERARLKQILKRVVPEDAGVIVRTAAEGASEDELRRDVERLQAQWEDIQKKARKGGAPTLLYGEPDMTVRVVRDIFNEDFSKVVISGDQAWETIHGYVSHVAPDLADRLQRWTSEVDVFATYRIDEQLMKALDRKVWLPSGGSLVIDRTEAMVVIDVNTGKFTGQGGNLEETVTRNNLEAAEEIVRQLRLRDLGGIIVIDFIDMVLESNRDLVMRRLLECLGRDRTKHQVAEVTSLGLVQMTRKRVGQGLLES
ncbi:Rne/Rng family ribonuclease, partial [Streptomyces barkulensis]|uniref:Rne/Rng family ribonuclease n=1 Tax=Streptomyces barkulensis TaxID=1257026 RepID=UPI001F1064EE